MNQAPAQSPSATPEKIYRLMETRADARIAIEEVVVLAKREIRVFDADPKTLRDRDFGTATRIDTLRAFLRAGRDHKLRIALHDTRGIEIELPRLITLLTNFSGQVHIYRTLGQAAEARDPMVIADDAHFWHKLHIDHPRSVLNLHSAADARPFVERFEEIWEQSEQGVTGSSLGL
jgi:hypothetical protein